MTKKGILLVNLGSPDSPKVPDVRRYLREFLMDGRVLDAPWPVRFFVVHALILPSRPKQSAEAYHKIWGPDGSPLVATSKQVQAELQRRTSAPISLAMRYQNPSIPAAVAELAMRIQVQAPFYDHPDYIKALVASANPYLQKGFDHLLFSFHGIPERHLRKADPTGAHCLASNDCCHVDSPAHQTCYRAQCLKTVAAFVREASLPSGKYSVSFQSRLGNEPWLTPYTDLELPRFARHGVKTILVICPAFVSDCLETLEEIGMRGRDCFLEAGGQELTLIPCLNTHPLWLTTLEGMIARFLGPAESSEPGAPAAHEG